MCNDYQRPKRSLSPGYKGLFDGFVKAQVQARVSVERKRALSKAEEFQERVYSVNCARIRQKGGGMLERVHAAR